MNQKIEKFFLVVFFLLTFGVAFAQQPNGSAYNELASMTSDSNLQTPLANPVPVKVTEMLINSRLRDITDMCTISGEVVTAYPEIYKQINSAENNIIIRVFVFTNSKGEEKRIEVCYTGGDWMQYGQVYILTNASKNEKAVAFYVPNLSAQDVELGEIAPKVNPLDTGKLTQFINDDFLDKYGNVKTGFKQVAS